MRETDTCDVIDALSETLCKGCPREKECNDPNGFYGNPDIGGSNAQLVQCIWAMMRAGLMQKVKPPERFEAEKCMVKCPIEKCGAVIDVDDDLDGDVGDKLEHVGDSVETTCPECGTKLKITVGKHLYLNVEARPE